MGQFPGCLGKNLNIYSLNPRKNQGHTHTETTNSTEDLDILKNLVIPPPARVRVPIKVLISFLATMKTNVADELSVCLIIAKLSSLLKKAAPGTTVTVSLAALIRSGSTCRGSCSQCSPHHFDTLKKWPQNLFRLQQTQKKVKLGRAPYLIKREISVLVQSLKIWR